MYNVTSGCDQILSDSAPTLFVMMPRVTSLGSTSFRRYSIAASRAYSSDGKQTPPATPSHPHPSQSYLGPDAGDHRTPVKARTSNVAEHVFIAARNRADALTASAMASISRLGFQLNRITGYEDIETLKERVSQNGETPARTHATLQPTLIEFHRAQTQGRPTSRP